MVKSVPDKVRKAITIAAVILNFYLLLLVFVNANLIKVSILIYMLAFASYFLLLVFNNYNFFKNSKLIVFLRSYHRLNESGVLSIYFATVLVLFYFKNSAGIKNFLLKYNFLPKIFAIAALALILTLPILSKKIIKTTEKIKKKLRSYFVFSGYHIEEHKGYVDVLDVVVSKSCNGIDKYALKKRPPPRTIKGLKKITDPSFKIRYAYGFIIEQLVNKEIKINKSDTTGQIYLKSKKLPGAEGHVMKITHMYEYVRYGEKIPLETEVSLAENCCHEIITVLKNEKISTYPD